MKRRIQTIKSQSLTRIGAACDPSNPRTYLPNQEKPSSNNTSERKMSAGAD